MAEFGPESTIRDVLEGSAEGRQLLFAHGYDVGDGFVDLLSQYQTLLTAARAGRLRDVEGLIRSLNESARA